MEAELLVTLIEKYGKEHYPISRPEPIEAVKGTMDRKGVKGKALIRLLEEKPGIASSQIKKRPLTIDMLRDLSFLLRLPVEVFIQPSGLDGKQEKVRV